MTHKQRCIDHCKDYLQQLSLPDVFCTKAFQHYYRKHQGAQGNPFNVGLSAADMMIRESKPVAM